MVGKSIAVAAFSLSVSVLSATDGLAGEVGVGPSHAGVRLNYEGLELGGKGAVRFNLTCTKNWGGGTGGVANVVAYYIDQSGEIAMREETVSCSVRGGEDGARKSSSGTAKTLTIPVPLKEAEVRAYIGHEVADGSVIIDNIVKNINKVVEDATFKVVKKPISTGSDLEQAVAPAGGQKLTF